MRISSTTVIVLCALGLVLYRVLPSFVGAPVFGLDAWPELADSRFLLMNGHANLFLCSGLPSCYEASWPGLVVLTAMFSLITSLSLYWSPAAITVAVSLLFSLVLILIGKLIYEPSAPFVAAIAATSALFNIFYSGYKEEMLAMPLFATMLFVLLVWRRKPDKLEGRGLSLRSPFVVTALILALGVVDSHHYTTVVMISTLAIVIVYDLVRSRLVKIERQLTIFTMVVAGMILTYYFAQELEPLQVTKYSGSFLFTIIAYAVVIALIGWKLISDDRLAKRLPLIVGAIILLAVVSIPLVARLLYAQVTLPLLVILAGEIPFLMIVSYSLRVLLKLNRKATVMLMAWSVMPLSLGFSSLFDGNALLMYRGFTSLLFPLIIMAGVTTSFLIGRREITGMPPRRPTKILVGSLLIAFIILGVLAEAQPYLQQRDVTNGATWFYTMSSLSQAATATSFVPKNETLFTDLPIMSYLVFQGFPTNVSAARPNDFSLEANVATLLMLRTMDTNEFYFYGGFSNVRVDVLLPNQSLVFDTGSYLVYAK